MGYDVLLTSHISMVIVILSDALVAVLTFDCIDKCSLTLASDINSVPEIFQLLAGL